jgi:MFS family permease
MAEVQERGNARLFSIAFASIMATSFAFILRALVVDEWGVEFALSETQKGELLGVGLWPFAITIVLLSLIIDRIGFKATFWFAAACHAIGLAILLMATGYWTLYIGTLIMALGNGAVEAGANPLVATIYRQDKSAWLNRVHAAWPGGMILGGILAMMLGNSVHWQVKVALMALPVAVYALLLLRVRFPVSERVAAGVSYKEMLAEAGFLSAFVIIGLMMMEVGRVFGFPSWLTIGAVGLLTAAYAFYARSAGRPLYVILVLIMIPLATTELSTDSWISSLMEPEMTAMGLQAGWVLVYTAMIVFVMRLVAGPIIHRIKPLGVLALASALAAAGLFMLAGSTGMALLAAATLYGIGKSFFWGTTLGVVSEQFPRGGAVTLNVVAGAGMLAAGVLGSVMLGAAQDSATSRTLAQHDAQNGTALVSSYLTAEKTSVFGKYTALDPAKVATAPAADKAALDAVANSSKKAALREVAILPLIMLAAYLALIFFFRSRGGYRPVVLNQTAPAE